MVFFGDVGIMSRCGSIVELWGFKGWLLLSLVNFYWDCVGCDVDTFVACWDMNLLSRGML